MTDLSSLETRVVTYVNDAGFVLYAAGQAEEGIRQALDLVSINTGQTYTIDGLDAFLETTLPVTLESLIVQGGAGFMVAGQDAAAILGANIAPGAPAALLAWGHAQLDRFFQRVDVLRIQALQNSSDAPYSKWAWGENESSVGLGDDDPADRTGAGDVTVIHEG